VILPVKRTKLQRDELIYVYYGIEGRSLTVQSVAQSRDGTLRSERGQNLNQVHRVSPGQLAIFQITLLFGLTDVIAVPARLANKDNPALKRLEQQAADMRQVRDQTPDG
jgi:hypothetical protein